MRLLFPLVFLLLHLQPDSLSDFCQSSFEGFDRDEGDAAKPKEANGIKDERYSPWASDGVKVAGTGGSPTGPHQRDVYSGEQLVPAGTSYQPYRSVQPRVNHDDQSL